MKLLIRIAAAVAALALLCTACTDEGSADQPRVSVEAGGIDTALANQARANNSITAMVSRGQEVLAVLSIDTPGFDGHRAAYSVDNGVSWQAVLFDGRADPGMALAALPAVRDGQWLLLGHRHEEIFAFTSTNGRDFNLQQKTILDVSATNLNAVVGTDAGWLLATTPPKDSGGTAMTLYQSTDGAAWTPRDGTAAGLPSARGTFHPLNMAAGPDTVLIVGQEVDHKQPPYARAFSSADGGSNWQDVSPDSSGVGMLGNALWTAAWSGSDFRVTGHAWPGVKVPKSYPSGMSGSWVPGGAWQLSADSSWSTQNQEFPHYSDVAYGPAGAIATQKVGEFSVDTANVVMQPPGQPWTRVQMPPPDDGGVRHYSDVAAVADGFLIAGTDSSKGNGQIRLWHVTGAGTVTERHTALEAATPLSGPGNAPHITGFGLEGDQPLAFGSVGSQPALWELRGKNLTAYDTLSTDNPGALDTMVSGPGGLMLLGSTRTAGTQRPVIWSRPLGGAWSVYNGNIFGAATVNGTPPVRAVLASSHGFLAAGWFTAEGANHAGMAVSSDGVTWSHSQDRQLRGTPSAGRSIYALSETPARAVLAGGSIAEGQSSTAAVWTSPDAQTWTPVLLPRAEEYTDARVESLTAGPLRTLAVISQSSAGKPTRYSTFSSSDNGATWDHGTDLTAPSAGQGTGVPRIAVQGNGFVLVATQGRLRQHTPVLLVSGDGMQFVARPLNHKVLEQEDLEVSALTVAANKLIIAGSVGPADRRESFVISTDVPHP